MENHGHHTDAKLCLFLFSLILFIYECFFSMSSRYCQLNLHIYSIVSNLCIIHFLSFINLHALLSEDHESL
jgi:hypothetical protein